MRKRELMRWTLLAFFLLAGCAPGESEPPPEETRIPVFPPAGQLQGPGGPLTFWVEEAHIDPALFPAGLSCATGQGRWMLRMLKMDGDYEGRFLFVEAVEQEGRLTPTGVGLLFMTCTGAYWIPGLAGSLVLDSSVEDRLRVRAELHGEFDGTPHAFVGDYLIRLGEGCHELEPELATFGLR